MFIKKLWNNSSIDVVEVSGRWFALYGWNGYEYIDCWETDENTFSLDDGVSYIIKPIYKVFSDTNDIEDIDGNMEIIGYDLV